LGLLSILFVSVFTGLVWLRQSVPDYDARLVASGLEAPVTVVRDTKAVPHIFAETPTDAYFALGYLHAQDRLWQMDIMRRMGAGRMSELFGTILGDWPLTLDRAMRTLGFYRQAERSVLALSPEVRRDLEAYAAGVNHYLDSRTDLLPIEFQLLQYEPAPWRPADSLVWGKLMGLLLSGNANMELLRARLLGKLSEAEVDALFPVDSHMPPITLAPALREALILDGPDDPTGPLARVQAALALNPWPTTASNEWVVAGEHTESGKPILANDPHLGLRAPILWYLARIVTPQLSLAGATVPGVPLHVIGHNGTIAWGLTTTHSDTQDLFIERLDPDDPTRYLTPDGPHPFATRLETIRVRGGDDVEITVRTTRHGPVVSDILPNLARQLVGETHVVSLAFTGLSEQDTSGEALYRVNRARSWAAFRDALRLLKVPQQNIVYADTAGNIGLVAPGDVPIRRGGDGRVPAPGWVADYDWTGMVPFDALPQVFNPPDGRLVNANNALVGPDYPYLLTADWPDAYRAQRILDWLRADGDRHSLVRSQSLQMDTLSLAAQDLLPVLLKTLPQPSDPLSRQLIRLLDGWDYHMDRDSAAALIYQTWLREVNRGLFEPRLADLFGSYWQPNVRVVQRILTEAPDWCRPDRPTDAAPQSNGANGANAAAHSERPHSCATAVATALRTTGIKLTARHGSNPQHWRWGDEHRAPLDHMMLSKIPVLRGMFDIGTETAGAVHTVNRGTSRFSDADAPFEHIHGAGLRAVFTLDDLNRSGFIIATGQSGNPVSDHYDDFVALWRDGALVTLTGPQETLRARGLGTTRFVPAETE